MQQFVTYIIQIYNTFNHKEIRRQTLMLTFGRFFKNGLQYNNVGAGARAGAASNKFFPAPEPQKNDKNVYQY
jgi:hypothetical protein